MPVYLDHAATSPLRPEAREAMLPWLGERFGNPSGAHAVARAARQAVDEAREVVAAALGFEPREIVFTSGGTEADNLAVHGATRPVCSAVEHHAVLDAVDASLPVDAQGRVEPAGVRAAVEGGADLVSVMLVNNEVGTINDLDAVVTATRGLALLHTDAVQGLPWLDVAAAARTADLVSVSAHKIGGPQGVGALAVREGIGLRPLSAGGGQERDRRSGTHNVAGIVGFAAAVVACAAARDEEGRRIAQLRARLAEGVLAAVPDARETVDRAVTVPGICSLQFDGVESEALVVLLDRMGVCASAASACASGAMRASHVLDAIGAGPGGVLRLSLGWTTTGADIDEALGVVPRAVAQLRERAA